MVGISRSGRRSMRARGRDWTSAPGRTPCRPRTRPTRPRSWRTPPSRGGAQRLVAASAAKARDDALALRLWADEPFTRC